VRVARLSSRLQYIKDAVEFVVVKLGIRRLNKLDDMTFVRVTEEITRYLQDRDWRTTDIRKIAPLAMMACFVPTEEDNETFSALPSAVLRNYRALHGQGPENGN
jgi:hypothetical protein